MPLAREQPDDGGARRLEADCDSMDGKLLLDAGRPAEGRSSLEQARVLYESLIRDNPRYTLPTAADGPTEYRRGLVNALDRIGETYHLESRHDEVLRIMAELQAVSAELVAGRFAEDTDRQRLGQSYQTTGWSLNFLRPPVEAIQATERGLAIFRQLADASPTMTEYKLAKARCLKQIGFIYVRLNVAKARKYALAAMAVVRALAPEQTAGTGYYIETSYERVLGSYDLARGRIGDALAHMRRSVSVMEEAARAHPDYVPYQEEVGSALVGLAVTELIVGDAKGALRTAGRIGELVEPVLRKHSDLRYTWNWKIVSLLIEAYLDLRAGKVGEASQVADRAAATFQMLKPPLTGQEHFFSRGCRGRLFYATGGRPATDDRPAETPGLRHHAELRRVDEVWQAYRMGYQAPTVVAIVDGLLGGRPEVKLLIMDQVFPADPFRPEPGSKDDDPASDPQGTKP